MPNFFYYPFTLSLIVLRFRYTAYPKHKNESSSATSQPSPRGASVLIGGSIVEFLLP